MSLDSVDTAYIHTRTARHDVRKLTLKSGHTFAVFDSYGDLLAEEHWELGVYHHGTRLLSRLELLIDGQPPMLLSSNVERNNLSISIDLANPDITITDGMFLSRGSLHGHRNIHLREGALMQELIWHNYSDMPISVPIQFNFNADFADIFEVRGQQRAERGTSSVCIMDEKSVSFSYVGLDKKERLARLQFSQAPDGLSETGATLTLQLAPHESVGHFVSVFLDTHSTEPPNAECFARSLTQLRQQRFAASEAECEILTSNERLNEAINRSAADLWMLRTETDNGPYPFAGTPWYSTIFGRDGLWTALFCNWANPELSRGVLGVLAATQAREVSREHDAEPGKIIHEIRDGEMAVLGEVPYRRYYGSVDATPLFVMLAVRYFERTGDLAFIREIWPNIQAALRWMDTYGDKDADGFIEYDRQTPAGLANQGWKDSHDAVFHADGTLARGPIALCEVQAYAYAAKRGASKLADLLGATEDAENLRETAARLRDAFELAFWDDELGCYVIALDGNKEPCRVISSNSGHVLMTGLCSQERAEATAATLMSDEAFGGWGIRTLAEGTQRYNPMSYHNGSIWPHDNAIIAEGFARYDMPHNVSRIAEGLLDAASFMDLGRLPELFCGFPRRAGVAPTLYPVACSPQAWASASVYSLLQSSLGIQISAIDRKMTFKRPFLPQTHDHVLISRLRVDNAMLDVSLAREYQNVAVNVLKRTGEVDIVVEM